MVHDTHFDPDAAAPEGGGLFGLPYGPDDAHVHVLPVPFDATCSYRRGAARGPRAILAASVQVDLFDMQTGRPWEVGIWMAEPDPAIVAANEEASPLAEAVIERGGRVEGDKRLVRGLARVNELGGIVNERVHAATAAVLDAGRLPAIVGGDHSAPFGAIRAASERFPGLGVLHFDAHADLRDAYEGFRWSHASILHNVLEELPGVSRVVQVGLRDVGEAEVERIRSDARLASLFDHEWSRAGADAHSKLRRTLAELPDELWITFDVDGLDPALCPNTGTPVPGGLSWREALLWLDELANAGKRVVGLDLCEVNPGATPDGEDAWDAIVGARLLYKLIGTALMTRRR